MKKYLLTLLTILAFAGNVRSQTFVHPGGLHTLEDLDRMKEKVAAGESPWIEGWNALVSDGKSSASYGISGGVRENANQRQNMNRDAQAAYLNALRWYISGDVAHAEKAISIYNAYANTVNQIPSGGTTDILGLGGIGFTAMAMGAEIMRLYGGWAPEDFEKFKFMMKEYFYPVSHDFLTNHKGACPTYYWANWDLNNVSALLAIGILVDDQDIFNEGIAYFKSGIGAGNIHNAVPFVQGNFGQWQESGRDQSHALLGIGLTANICQLAWNQGVDLYGYDDNRFLKGAEYAARTGALSLEAPFFEEYDSCANRGHRWIASNALGRYFDQPVWEIVYNHYVVKQGLEASHVEAMAQIMRFAGSTNDQLGHGTLTYTLDAAASPLAFTAPPGQQLQGLTVKEGINRVELTWNAVETMDAEGFTVKRATNSGGPYTTVASWRDSTNPRYTDTNVENGTTYYYVVSAKNEVGDGPGSVEISATPMDAVQELPVGWTRTDIGNVSIEGEAVYAEVNTGHTFITKGAGSIGGTSDALGFTYGIASGDVTLTARVADFEGVQKTGIMIRESLDPDAKTVLMKIGDGGWRIAGMGTRTGTGANMEWKDGNRYTWRPDIWFRISRTGNTFTVYESNNKDVWFEVGRRTIDMAGNVYVGLFNSSGNTTSLNTTQYDHVAITGLVGNAPEAPANVTASPGNTLNILNWDEVTGASSYTLKRSTTSGGPYEIVGANLNVTQYTDTGLENGTTYYYVVTAANFAGEGQNSAEVNTAPVLALPPVPAEVVAASVSGTRIDLSWEASLSAVSYNVQRSETDGGPYTTIASPTVTMYSDTGLVASTTYYYVISAVNEIGETVISDQVKAIPGHVNYWKFDETTGKNATDSWGNSVGILSPGATFTAGIMDNAVGLDGIDGYVTLPQGVVNHLTDFSISLWLKLDEVRNWTRIFDFGSGTGNFMFLTPSNGATGTLRYGIDNGTGQQQVNTTTKLTAGRWYHLVLTQAGTSAILYVDGVEVGRNDNMSIDPSSLGNTTQNWMGRSQYPDPLLAGQVDDFRIYNTALNASEVTDMVLAYLPPATPENLVSIAENNQIVLNWTASPGSTGYNVKRATDIGGAFEVIANVFETQYADTTVVNCKNYFYTVSSVNKIGESPNSLPSGPSLGSRLSGTLIGTDGSWNNNPATTKAAAVDGDITTYFDASVNTAWVGYDLGADGKSVITRVRYAPRSGFSHRMNGTQIQGANTPDFSDAETLLVIPKPAEWVMTEQPISNSGGYRYIRFLSPNGFGSIAELEFYGLGALLPEFNGEPVVEGTYDSIFHYSTVASNMPKEFMATGLPDGLEMDSCTGIITGVPTVAGTFPVAITATNYYGSVTDTIEVVIKKNQTIGFNVISPKHIGDVDFKLTAVASSGLPITYSSSDTTIATIVDGNNLHINAVGTCVITASQVGDSIYKPADPVDQSFTVIPLNLSVLHKDGDSGSVSNSSIKPYLQLVNGDSIGIPYSELTIRYWLTPENYSGINTWIDYAALGTNLVSANYVALETPHSGAFGYVEYSFDPQAGVATNGGNSGPIQSRLANTDGTNLNELDDHSYLSNSTYAVNDHITLYRNGYLIWGTEPAEVNPDLSLKVYSENKNSNTGTGTIKTYLKLVNEGNVPVDYKNLSIRYWFTKDSEAALNSWIDYAALGAANISGRFVALDPAFSAADSYFEISVDSALGSLYPLSNTGEIQYRITKTDWSKFEESDDHSYLTKGPFAENDHITVYYKGALVYGMEPNGNHLKKSNDSPKIADMAQLEIDGLRVYPNPVLEKLTVLLDSDNEEVQLMLHNGTGVLLITTKVKGEKHELDLSTMPEGLYILTITDANGSTVRKVVKE